MARKGKKWQALLRKRIVNEVTFRFMGISVLKLIDCKCIGILVL